MINIYKDLIKKYIGRITPQDIKAYATNIKIPITEEESSIIHKFIATHWQELLDGQTDCFELLKKELRPDLYTQVVALYKENKFKYLS